MILDNFFTTTDKEKVLSPLFFLNNNLHTEKTLDTFWGPVAVFPTGMDVEYITLFLSGLFLMSI